MLIFACVDIFLVNIVYLLSINIIYADEFSKTATIYKNDWIIVSMIYLVSFFIFNMYSFFVFNRLRREKEFQV